jgi:site-specific DNA-methyltransferase (adenine-specific)
MPRALFIEGDSSKLIGSLEPASIDTVITSPPYFGLRDYSGGVAEIGREESRVEYVDRLAKTLDRLRVPLKGSGSLWLNLGDRYVAGNQLGLPWRVRFALEDLGWPLKSEVIWHKPCCLPSNARDRLTVDHETVFLLGHPDGAKTQLDLEAIKEPSVSLDPTHPSFRPNSARIAAEGRKTYSAKHRKTGRAYANTRRKRTVWRVAPSPFKGAHFAVFPPQLIEPMVLAGAPKGGVVLDPFSGAGTTALVALSAGRDFVGIELNPEYIKLACDRLRAAGFDDISRQ